MHGCLNRIRITRGVRVYTPEEILEFYALCLCRFDFEYNRDNNWQGLDGEKYFNLPG